MAKRRQKATQQVKGNEPDPTSASVPPPETQAPPSSESAPTFPIVGIGASAGGLAAFEAFFSAIPLDVDPGMAFVLVQHLAPDHKSILSALLRRYTRMPVYEVQDGMTVQPNCAYIIPPDCDMALLRGTLQLLQPSSPRGQRLPIDYFFRSLASDQRERAIGIVLSGTGTDGTLGVRAIKGEGGMVMVQTPESTEFDGMPRSVIATGVVDYELSPAKMPAQLLSYVNHAFGRSPVVSPTPKVENALKKIFILLRTQTGHDFSQYKPSSVNRRIERRMAMHQIGALEGYVKFLQHSSVEMDGLFRDLLIGVTNFFRDPEAFDALEKQIIPKLFEGRPAGSPIRIWTPGCSTGEEAYSLAILLVERLEVLKQSHPVNVFATDIDARAIATARAGIYPASIAADISPTRLARFFTAEPGTAGFRINKSIRDMLVFSEQDLIRDPPFSKLDLISCRNVLIYMNGDLQKRIMLLFHYALKWGSHLFLGTSESVGDNSDLFAVLDRKAKLYLRKQDHGIARRGALGDFLTNTTATGGELTRAPGKVEGGIKLPLRELTERTLLQMLDPIGVLINSRGDILYVHGRTGMYLEPAQGEATFNILKLAREGLRRSLTTALHKVVATRGIVRTPEVRVKSNGHYTLVDLVIHPVAGVAGALTELPLYLVVLSGTPVIEPEKTEAATAVAISGEGEASRLAQLQQELQAKEEYIQSTHEEMETANEELKSSNEEMQSVNEELQSTNEELETAKEEMQSVNEELSTVNAELQTKLGDLSRANNDMNNLLAGTGIGTVFVDHELRMLRFTPAAREIINLIPSDTGRLVSDIASNLLDYQNLGLDVRAVLDTLVPKEVEVRTKTGNRYAMRIQPYRTLENVIEGAVLTFVNINELAKARAELRSLAAIMHDAYYAIVVQDTQGRILAWNPGAERMYGWNATEALKMNARAYIPPPLRESESDKLLQLTQAEVVMPYPSQRLSKDGTVVDVEVTASALLDEAGDGMPMRS